MHDPFANIAHSASTSSNAIPASLPTSTTTATATNVSARG